MKCSSCAASVRDRDNFCWNCGSRVGAGAVTHAGSCRACGFKLPVGSKFCGNCGVLQASLPDGSVGAAEPDEMVTPKPATVPGTAIRVVEGGSGRIDRVSDLADDDDDLPPRPGNGRPPTGKHEPLSPEALRQRPSALERGSATFGPKRPIGLARVPPKTEPHPHVDLPPPPSSLAFERQARSQHTEPGRQPPATWPDLRGELSELAFLRQQGLEQEARTALAQLQARYPGHPDLSDAEPEPEGTSRARPAPSERTRTLRGPQTYTRTEAVPVLPPNKPVTIETAAIPLFEPPDMNDTPTSFVFSREAVASQGSTAATEPAPSKLAPSPSPEESPSKRIELTLEDLDDNEIDAVLEDIAPQDTQRSATVVASSSSSSSDALELDPDELVEDPSGTSMSAITAIDPHDDDVDTGATVSRADAGGTMIAPLPKPPTVPEFPSVPDLLNMDLPDPADRTVVAKGPQPPRPFGANGAGAPPRRNTAIPEDPRRVTLIPEDPSRPSPPKPYANDKRVTISASAVSGETTVPPDEPFEVELDDPVSLITTEGTVIARNPFATGALGGASTPQPILPVRLAMVGSRGQTITEHVIEPGEIFEIGRRSEEPWRDDEHMLPVHARVTSAAGGGVQVQEVEPKGAVFRKLMRKEPLQDGDEVRVGQSIVSFKASASTPGTLGRLRVQSHGKGPVDTIEITPRDVLIGREIGEVVFPDDTYVSGEHCRIRQENGGLVLEDLGSSNGTYLRVRPGEVIPFEALLLIGQTQFCILEI